MEVALIAGVVGALVSTWPIAVAQRAQARKAVAAAARIRAAIAADMQIVKGLPPDSPAAARLNQVIELRLNAYLGPRPLRLRSSLLFLAFMAACVVWMSVSLSGAVSTADDIAYGSGVGFFGGFLLQDGRNVALAYLRRRRAVAAPVPPPDDSTSTPLTAPEPEPPAPATVPNADAETPPPSPKSGVVPAPPVLR